MKDHRTIEHLAAAVLPSMSMQPLPARIEKFNEAELAHLRMELLRHQLDSWQAADVTASFLAGHGYGADAATLRALIAGIDMPRCSPACLQSALETVAYIQ